jgi:hypothetical protein
MWYPPGLSLEYGRDHAKFIDSEGKVDEDGHGFDSHVITIIITS